LILLVWLIDWLGPVVFSAGKHFFAANMAKDTAIGTEDGIGKTGKRRRFSSRAKARRSPVW
jgi:hypothetical protein